DNTDRAIGRLVKKLDSMGELENTIIVYMSDHGSYRQERNGELRNGKGSLLEGGIRTPGIFYWPREIRGGGVEDTPAGSLDILPTLCGLIGIEKPGGVPLDGEDLAPLLTGQSSKLERRQPLSWHSPTSQPVAVIREGKHTLVGWRTREYPKDKAAIDAVMEQMRAIVEKKEGRELSASELWHRCYNSPLKTEDWKKLRSRFVTLNTFQESWIPLIKKGAGDITRFELFDLSKDIGQRRNIAIQEPKVFHRLQKKMLAIHGEVLREAPDWSNRNGEGIRIHRLKSKKRSAFDALVYVNRIPIEPDDEETQEDLSYRIFSRLSNQEGRVQIKLPPTMSREAYEGFKIAVAPGKVAHAGQCTQCHRLPDFADNLNKQVVPSLRNRNDSLARLSKILANRTHREIRLDENDIKHLYQWLQTLKDVTDSEFRNLIIRSTVMDSPEGKK
ncbi:MAG: sulfatase-like hydrolase/transferase, partial [Planctomycetota bacterium]|nr:sulfatase-like hydrolase/transferase [Planctomycetota bacterium]